MISDYYNSYSFLNLFDSVPFLKTRFQKKLKYRVYIPTERGENKNDKEKSINFFIWYESTFINQWWEGAKKKREIGKEKKNEKNPRFDLKPEMTEFKTEKELPEKLFSPFIMVFTTVF